jgi:RNA polymerase sigma factor (sigma-70 family)
MSIQSNDFLSDYARTLIRVKARQLVRRPEFTTCEVQDLEQELTLHILSRLDRFDPDRGSLNTYCARIVNTAIAMLIRERGRIKRNGGTGVEIKSLEKMVDQGDRAPAPLQSTISQTDTNRRFQSQPLSPLEQSQLRMDVQAVLDKLSPELRSICERMLSENKADVRQSSGMSRRKFDAAIGLIREQFTKSGLSIE